MGPCQSKRVVVSVVYGPSKKELEAKAAKTTTAPSPSSSRATSMASIDGDDGNSVQSTKQDPSNLTVAAVVQQQQEGESSPVRALPGNGGCFLRAQNSFDLNRAEFVRRRSRCATQKPAIARTPRP